MGVEAMRINIAGLSRIEKLELGLSNNRLFSGTGMNLNSLGMGIKLGKSGAIGFEFASLDFGQIPVTTVNQPAGTGGFFSPSFFQLGMGYSYTYANKISVGMLVRLVSESIQDVNMFQDPRTTLSWEFPFEILDRLWLSGVKVFL
jgi:hypothetical protein